MVRKVIQCLLEWVRSIDFHVLDSANPLFRQNCAQSFSSLHHREAKIEEQVIIFLLKKWLYAIVTDCRTLWMQPGIHVNFKEYYWRPHEMKPHTLIFVQMLSHEIPFLKLWKILRGQSWRAKNGISPLTNLKLCKLSVFGLLVRWGMVDNPTSE